MNIRIPLLRTLATLGLACLMAVSCDSPSEPLGQLSLVVVSGSGQEGPPSTELPAPLVVRVTDSRGRTVSGQVVNFNVIEGGGSVYAGVAITNSRGLAQERWTLGPSGTQRVEARAIDNNTGATLNFGTFTATLLDLVPPEVSDLTANPVHPTPDDAVTVRAVVTDPAPVISTVAGAQYQIDGGAYTGMTAEDGAFDNSVEAVTVTLPAFGAEGTHTVCIRGTDSRGNIGAPECVTFEVRPAGLGLILFEVQSSTFTLWMMNDDGSNQHQVYGGPAVSGDLSYDGTKIVHSLPTNGGEIITRNADGSGGVQLTNWGAPDYTPRWSPDGQQIAWIRETSWGVGYREVFVMNADGSNVRQLTSNGTSEDGPAWSPDGTKIVFASYRDGNNEIYVMKADGTGQTRLTTDPADDFQPSFSPDGSTLAFVSTRSGTAELYLMNPDGTNIRRVTTHALGSYGPLFSPDGRRLVFHGHDGAGHVEVYSINIDGSGRTQLTSRGNAGASSWR